jgi:hypothetical protein
MSDKWADIFSKAGKPDQQKLLDYLEGKLSEEEKHEVEKMMADSDFMNDAMEGLEQVKDKQKIAGILLELNSSLNKKIKQRRDRQFKRKVPDQTLLIITTVSILVLIVIAYIVYRMYTTR